MYEIKLKRDDNNLEIIPSHTVLVSLVTCVLISSSYDNNKKLSSSSPERYCTNRSNCLSCYGLYALFTLCIGALQLHLLCTTAACNSMSRVLCQITGCEETLNAATGLFSCHR